MRTPSIRDTRIDGIKFVLICLVILGHISYYDYGLGINRIIYSFHMPLFVMISGYFTHRQSLKHLEKSSLKLLALYFIFQTAHMLFNALVLGIPFSFSGYLNPAIALWYLICLLVWRCAYHLLRPLGIKLQYALVISVFVSALVGYIPLGNDFLAFQRLFSFLPFFIFGLMLRDGELKQKLFHLNLPLLVTTLLLAIVCARILPGFMPSSSYVEWYDPILRLIQTVLAFIICIGIIRFFPHRMPRLLCTLGQWTLYFYLYHTFMVKTLPIIIKHYPQMELNVLEALVCTFVIVTVIALMHRVKLFRLLLLEH